MIVSTPTGRQRHRMQTTGLFRKKQLLVLQLEYRDTGSVPDQHGCGLDIDNTVWRDARVEDISSGFEKESK